MGEGGSMNAGINSLLKRLSDFEEKDPKSRGLDLRLDLADIIIEQLSDRGWTQGELARRAKMRESQISLILTASRNCTFDTAGRILFALGVKGKLVKQDETTSVVHHLFTVADFVASHVGEAETHAKCFTQKEDKTEEAPANYLVGAS